MAAVSWPIPVGSLKSPFPPGEVRPRQARVQKVFKGSQESVLDEVLDEAERDLGII